MKMKGHFFQPFIRFLAFFCQLDWKLDEGKLRMPKHSLSTMFYIPLNK